MGFWTFPCFCMVDSLLDLSCGEVVPGVMIFHRVRTQGFGGVTIEVFLKHTLEVVISWVFVLDSPGSLDEQEGYN